MRHRTTTYGAPRWSRTTLPALALLPCLGGCGEPADAGAARDTAAVAGPVVIDGSSTVYPIAEAVAEEFRAVAPDVRVTVGKSGTGGGFKAFAAGRSDVSNASRPIAPQELAALEAAGIAFVELPVAYDGLSVVVHPDNDWVDHLTIAELRAIFVEGQAASTWAEVRAGWPDEPIRIYAPGTDSGTFDYFREVVAGKGEAIRGDMSVSEDDNVLVNGVAGEKGAIGFFGCAYWFENRDKLRAVPIDGGSGPVEPTPDTILSGRYAPFSRPLFVYVHAASLAEKPQVREFVRFWLEHGPALAEEVGYVRLPDAISARARQRFDELRTGTAFVVGGERVHGTLAEVYRQ